MRSPDVRMFNECRLTATAIIRVPQDARLGSGRQPDSAGLKRDGVSHEGCLNQCSAGRRFLLLAATNPSPLLQF